MKSISITKSVFRYLIALFILQFVSTSALAAKSDIRSMIPLLTKVKDQQGRNTCTIFATIAVIESLYVREGGSNSVDFSEEWLQYLASVSTASGGAKGSMVSIDLNNARRWGLAQESTMPFTPGEWQGDEPDAQRMCGTEADNPNSLTYVRCLFGKRPASYISFSNGDLAQLPGGEEFGEARAEAAEFKAFTQGLRGTVIGESATKRYLDQNYPLALELNIFHGSWNTRVAEQKGIYMDPGKYKKGEVNYPELGSVDRKLSPQFGDLHAVQFLGYDDEMTMTYTKKMLDGTTKTFTRKGVYLFKNSWGTRDFGSRFVYDGLRMPGLGIIAQDHVREFGKITVFL